MFRLLKAEEIECRVAMVKEKGLSLLLYKDARADMRILDETVGAMNWQRRHTRDNANCIVSIWDGKQNRWVEKEDTGTESFTEKEKGLASDSFKRACFNWGIGRELYTGPFIWVSDNKCEITTTGSKSTTYDKFDVKEIGYDDIGNINHLVITNAKTGVEVYKLGKTQPAAKPPAAKPPVKDPGELGQRKQKSDDELKINKAHWDAFEALANNDKNILAMAVESIGYRSNKEIPVTKIKDMEAAIKRYMTKESA